uniref:Uncharacterized protein n=1 Tax=viral metagenome TaxID=1070528 RepID=A0A6M3K7U1_9ZZZZ
MKLINWFLGLLKKKKQIIVTPCKCGQNVDIELYNKKLKRHIIGVIYKNNKPLTLYCDGKERK